jgi:hypothetical protein
MPVFKLCLNPSPIKTTIKIGINQGRINFTWRSIYHL